MSDKTPNLKPYERRLIGKLLRLASDEFGNHNCNDFDLTEIGLTLAEQRALNKQYHTYNGDPEEYNPDWLHIPDFALMDYFADMIDPPATD